MALEQLRGAEPDRRTNIYCLRRDPLRNTHWRAAFPWQLRADTMSGLLTQEALQIPAPLGVQAPGLVRLPRMDKSWRLFAAPAQKWRRPILFQLRARNCNDSLPIICYSVAGRLGQRMGVKSSFPQRAAVCQRYGECKLQAVIHAVWSALENMPINPPFVALDSDWPISTIEWTQIFGASRGRFRRRQQPNQARSLPLAKNIAHSFLPTEVALPSFPTAAAAVKSGCAIAMEAVRCN